MSNRPIGTSRFTTTMAGKPAIVCPLMILFSVPLLAQPKPQEKLLNCRDIKGLSRPVLRNLSPHVKCRLETADLICLPGLRLVVDATEDEDLCGTSEKRVVTTPSCKAQSQRRYSQQVIKRGRYLVERAKGKVELENIDIPFTQVGRIELLAQTKPIRQKGRDACVYLRQIKTVFVDPSFPLKTAKQPKPKAP